MKKCPFCGKEFEPLSKKQKYDKRECGNWQNQLTWLEKMKYGEGWSDKIKKLIRL